MTLSVPRRSPTGRPLARRWDPVHAMEEVYDRMGRLMRDVFGDTAVTAALRLPDRSAPADIEETDDGYLVEIDLPSAKRDDINLELRDNRLRIAGEIKERERTGTVRRRARRVGEFEQVIALPGEVDPERVAASLANGVLTIRLGKASAARPRRIEIEDP